MIKLFLFSIAVILFQFSGVAQSEQPAYVMLEEVVVTSDDPRFAPLFYSTTENGEGSLTYDLIELVKTGKIEVFRSDILGGWKTSWDYIQHCLGKREKGQHIYGEIIDGKYFFGTLTKDIPYSLKNIQRYKLYYVTCRDEKYNLLSRDFVGLIPLSQYNQYTRTFYEPIAYFGMKEPMVSTILGKRCLQSSDSSLTYLNFLSLVPIDDLDSYSHFITPDVAGLLSEKFKYETPATKLFSYPEFINDSACLVIKELENFEYNDSNLNIYSNSFKNISNTFKEIQKQARLYNNLPFLEGRDIYGYSSISSVSIETLYNCHEAYSYDSLHFFSHRLNSAEIVVKAYKYDTIQSFDPFTGEINPDTVIVSVDGSVVRILELHDSSDVYPIAFCIGRNVYDEKRNFVGYYPLLWIPFDQQFISILDSNQAYLPGYPKQLTLWGYLLSGIYNGTIISERSIDNAELQEMLEVLK